LDFIATIGKDNAYTTRKEKEEKYTTCPNEQMNHRNYALKTIAQGKHSSAYVYF
jgi:hypothetical protein